MKSEAKASDTQMRNAAFDLLVAIIEGRLKDAEKHAETVTMLLHHMKRKSQDG